MDYKDYFYFKFNKKSYIDFRNLLLDKVKLDLIEDIDYFTLYKFNSINFKWAQIFHMDY